MIARGFRGSAGSWGGHRLRADRGGVQVRDRGAGEAVRHAVVNARLTGRPIAPPGLVQPRPGHSRPARPSPAPPEIPAILTSSPGRGHHANPVDRRRVSAR